MAEPPSSPAPASPASPPASGEGGPPHATGGNLRSFLGVSGTIGLSRMFGFAREMVMALVFGASLLYDMLVVAQRLRGMVETLLLETSLTRLLVRSFAERLESRQRLELWLRNCMGFMLLGALGIAAAALLAAHPLAWVMAPGFAPQATAQTASLLRLDMAIFPLTAMVALFSAWLFTFGRTVVPNLITLFRSTAVIAVGLLMYRWGMAEPTWVVLASVGGLSLGALAMFLWVRRVQPVSPLPTFRFGDPEALGFFRNGMGVAALSTPVQLQGLVMVAIGSQLATGAISWLYYSGKLVLLPQGVVGLSMGMVAIGRLSRLHAAGDEQGYRQTLDWSLRIALLISLPTAAGLAVLAEPVVWLAFQRGSFDAWDTLKTAIALRGYAPAIPFQILNIVLLTALFAREMHLRAMFINLLGAAAMVVGGYLLAVVADRGHGGLAVVSAPAQLLVTLSLLAVLWRRSIWRPSAGALVQAARALLATLLMAALVSLLADLWLPIAQPMRAHRVLGLIVVGALAYPALLLLLGLRPRHLVLSTAPGSQ